MQLVKQNSQAQRLKKKNVHCQEHFEFFAAKELYFVDKKLAKGKSLDFLRCLESRKVEN